MQFTFLCLHVLSFNHQFQLLWAVICQQIESDFHFVSMYSILIVELIQTQSTALCFHLVVKKHPCPNCSVESRREGKCAKDECESSISTITLLLAYHSVLPRAIIVFCSHESGVDLQIVFGFVLCPLKSIGFNMPTINTNIKAQMLHCCPFNRIQPHRGSCQACIVICEKYTHLTPNSP